MQNLVRALRFFRPDAPQVAGVLVLLLLSTAANLVKPWPLALIVDSVLGSKPWPAPVRGWLGTLEKPAAVAFLAGAMFVLHALQGVLSAAANYASIRIGLRGLTRVRNAVFEWLQRLSLRFYQGTSAGDLIHRAAWDTYAFQTLFQQGLISFATASLALLAMVAVMARLNGRLTLVALALVPMLVVAIRFFGRQMTDRTLAAQQADSRVTATVQQSLVALPLTQSCTREADEARRFDTLVAEARQRRLVQHATEIRYGLAITLLFGTGLAALAWLGARQVLADRLSIGQLLVFLAYLGQLYDPLNQLSYVGTTVSQAGAGTRRVFELLDTPEEVTEAANARSVRRPRPVPGSPTVAGAAASEPGAGERLHSPALPAVGGERPSPRRAGATAPAVMVPDPASTGRSGAVQPLFVNGAITFEHVSFGYQPGRLVLSDVGFSVTPGESLAIIGPSGAGKTTLLHLLPRLFDPTAGVVRLDGSDLRELRLKELRAQIALVFQEPILLPATVAENIAYGRPGATPAQIEAAARAAYADDFIRGLPRQYETVVGECAARLSVGEKQRLSLARAFLKDAPVLVLDEPTSALDAESEAFVLAGLTELIRGRTTLVAAHRPATIRRAERVLVLDQGRVAEFGRAEDLARAGGYFARVTGG